MRKPKSEASREFDRLKKSAQRRGHILRRSGFNYVLTDNHGQNVKAMQDLKWVSDELRMMPTPSRPVVSAQV
jgi:hypothetical protein